MTLRVGLVGCGMVARRMHLPGLRAVGAEIVAFASRTRASAEKAAAEWGRGDVLDNWTALLARDDIDAVDLCTPNALHAGAAVACAGAGKHVLVEKPMACTVADADRMIAAARDAGTVLLTAHNARFLPAVAAARDLVAAGRAGEIRAFRCAWGHGGPRGWAPDSTWFYERALAGGGALLDLGVHAIDTVRAVTGDDLRAVSAFIGPGNVEQTAQLALRTARGALGTIQASWEIASGADVQLTVQGTDATLHFDLRTPLTLFPVGGGAPARVPLPEQGPTIFDAFVAAVAGTPSPLITAADGRAAVAVVDAAYRSAATGTTVTVV